MNQEETFRVGEVARVARVTVRTLHHYDAIGLLRPSCRSDKGYRLYTRPDLLRLHQIRIQQQLGLSLAEIRAVLDDPSFDQRAALLAQRDRVRAELDTTKVMLAGIDAALEAMANPATIDFPTLFDGFDPATHEHEAHKRWGDTDAYRESARRTAAYGEDEWEQMRDEQAQLLEALAGAMRSGIPPSMAKLLADEHRQHIDRWFYPCNPEMHRNLSRLYTQDERFQLTFDEVAPGLAAYLVAAIESATSIPQR